MLFAAGLLPNRSDDDIVGMDVQLPAANIAGSRKSKEFP